ncbi:hypothetical protein ACFWYW_59155 [Nonomuraea sp. NPDC059023]|uniref:hypothetical protein n=1 Tax=unclassified Nonomuraea TaxID=2593643 RepID=UPI0036A4CB5F
MKDKITYTTAGGGTVTWEKREVRGSWECLACGRKDPDGNAYEANKHASGCWAR